MQQLYFEYGGGLGDVVNHVFWHSCYRYIEELGPEDKARVVLLSHNPYAKEFFLWHPKRHLLEIENLGYTHKGNDPDWRKEKGLPVPPKCDHPHSSAQIRFYPSPDDSEWIKMALNHTPYVIFSVSAGQQDRTIPVGIVDNATRRAFAKGFKPVFVGRNYVHHWNGCSTPPVPKRKEVEPNSLALNLIDRVSVPGVLELIRNAAGVFACHSSMCLASWHLNRPVFVLYEKNTKERYFSGEFVGYSFGAGRPDGDHGLFEEYTGEKMDNWLDKLHKA